VLRDPLHRRRRLTKAAAVVGALAATAAVSPLLAVTASADTAGNPYTTTANVGAGNQAPLSTLAGLVNGQNITLRVTSGGPALNQVEARLCSGTSNVAIQTDFNPTDTGQCVNAPLSAGTNDYVNRLVGPPNTDTGTYTFKVGTGSNTFQYVDVNTSNLATANITCDVANPCRLWLRESGAAGVFFAHYDLTFAGNPDAPAAPTGTAGSGSVNLSWSAPANTGNSPVDYYVITPYIGGVAQATIQTPTNATSYSVGSLANFTCYTFTVRAHNAAGFLGSESSASATLTPGPAPATNVTAGQPGNGSVVVSWTPPTDTTNLTGYLLTSYAGPSYATAGATQAVNSPAATSATFGGLTNNTSYKFTVIAVYGADNGPESAQSNAATPNNKVVYQVITANRPQGALDIAEACATGGTLTFGTYPQSCNVNLGTGVLNAAATYYVTPQTPIQTVSVQDTRDSDVGWNVNASVTSFTGPGTFSGGCLGFAPTATGLSTTPVYTQTITTGATTAANCAAPGLTAGGGVTVMTGGAPGTATPQGGLGRADLTGNLDLNIPVSAPAGAYTATLSFTVA